MFVGAVSDRAKLLVQTTHECLARAIAAGNHLIMCSHLRNDLYCVRHDVKPYSLTHSLTRLLPDCFNRAQYQFFAR